MRLRIRTQLLLPIVLLLGGVAGISITAAMAATRQAQQQIETRLRTVARFLDEEESFPLNRPIILMLRPLSGAEYLLQRRSGKIITSLPDDPQVLPPVAAVADNWQSLRLGSPVRIGGQNYLCSGIRLHRWQYQGDILYILYPESLWRDARWQAIWPSLLLGVSLGLAALLLALGQARRLGRRIQDLDRQTRLIAAGDFSPMPLPPHDDEIRDLTHSVNEMAQQLAQFQKTVESTERLRLLGQVSGGLAHQLRNGLTGARLAIQLHLRETSHLTDCTALEVALRQLTLLETHVKRFLDLGRTTPSQTQPCSLTALVNEAVDLLQPQCRHAGIGLIWAPPTQPLTLLGDGGQLQQLLVNLIGNAIEAAGLDGSVEVRAAEEPERNLLLEVLDTGPGPPREMASRLFEPFVTSKPEGVGLGLAVARQIVEGHGGRISWLRRDGRTCFRVELPASQLQ